MYVAFWCAFQSEDIKRKLWLLVLLSVRAATLDLTRDVSGRKKIDQKVTTEIILSTHVRILEVHF